MRTRLVVGLLGMVVASAPAAETPPAAQAPPRHFFVLMQLGPRYDKSLPIAEQKALPAHSAYMKELSAKGTLVVGGPLLASFDSMEPTGAILILRAETEAEARAIMAGDPSGLLSVQEVRAFVMAARPTP